MSKKNQFYPGFNDENLDRDKQWKDELGETRNIDDLSFDEENNSYEIDKPESDEQYDHPNPYRTSPVNKSDYDSDFDEANKEALDHYTDDDEDTPLEEERLEEDGMHIDDGDIVHLDPIDESLAETPEDQRDDLDEEGYPKNDEPMK